MPHNEINHTCWATQQVTYFSRALLRRSFCGGVKALNESDPFFVATLSTLPFNTARFNFHNIRLIRQKKLFVPVLATFSTEMSFCNWYA